MSKIKKVTEGEEGEEEEEEEEGGGGGGKMFSITSSRCKLFCSLFVGDLIFIGNLLRYRGTVWYWNIVPVIKN